MASSPVCRMRDDREVADAIGDAIRSRVHPAAGPAAGDAVLAALALRGWRLIRGHHTVVNASWLADVLVQLNSVPTHHDTTAGQKAAAYDRLVAALNRHGRGAI